MRANDDLSIKKINKLWLYNPRTGLLYWKVGHHNTIKAGDQAGVFHGGYIKINYYKRYRAHRIAWAIYYGEWPKGEIDHKDTNKINNKINNLRVATHQQNGRNRPVQTNNILKTKGVTLAVRSNKIKYIAQIGYNNVNNYLGMFNTKEEAQKAYKKAAKKYHKEFKRF